jgi:hypothetical protein
MKINLAYLFFALCGVTVSHVQANEPDEAVVKSKPRVSVPQTKPIYVKPADRKQITKKPITVTQVERQTGGKVIGARSIKVHGQQLNQIKVLMPNGRIIIHEQLFDENGRSVETVDEVEPIPEIQTKKTED